MSFNSDQFRDLIKTTLAELAYVIPVTDNAVELLMLTAAQESHLGTYIMQLKGPARGVFQMEPRTEKDIWENFLQYKPDLRALVGALRLRHPGHDDLDLLANLPYQIAMARILYYRVKEPLPDDPSDITSLARYWKQHYNTPLGAGEVLEAVGNYERFCK